MRKKREELYKQLDRIHFLPLLLMFLASLHIAFLSLSSRHSFYKTETGSWLAGTTL